MPSAASAPKPLQISGKNLGHLGLSTACARCFWLEVHCKPLPYQFFPGIFSSIDSYTKKVLHGCYDATSSFPRWMSPLGDLTGYINPPHHSKFRHTCPDTSIILTGAADGIYKRKDNSIIIIDYKTARFTDGQDEMLPIYETQLNAYRWIAEELELGTVSDLYLIYFEPCTEENDALHSLSVLDDGFRLVFKPKYHKVNINLDNVKELLRKARAICGEGKPPAGYADCKNCLRLEAVVGRITS
jgi:hypothetical protein